MGGRVLLERNRAHAKRPRAALGADLSKGCQQLLPGRAPSL